jgi:flavodoxin
MKSIIIYYSYSGNTRKVAHILAECLGKPQEVKTHELRAQDESSNFFGQCRRAFWHKIAKIEPVNFELNQFDRICLGTPVWAFGPAPAVNAFLEQCKGVTDKDILLFTTYGSGTGNNRCIDYMQRALIGKGAKNFKRFSIQQFKVGDKDFILSKIQETMRLWPNG